MGAGIGAFRGGEANGLGLGECLRTSSSAGSHSSSLAPDPCRDESWGRTLSQCGVSLAIFIWRIAGTARVVGNKAVPTVGVERFVS